MSKRCKKYSKTKSKSRNIRGGGFPKEYYRDEFIKLQEMSKTIKDPHELKKFGEEQLEPALKAWEEASYKEPTATTANIPTQLGIGGMSRRRRRARRSRRNATNKKHKKARKSRRRVRS